MYLSELSDRVVQAVDEAISADVPEDERETVLKIVRQALLDASKRAHQDYKETVVACCGPEADLAHKIQDELDKKRDMLIANLMAMR